MNNLINIILLLYLIDTILKFFIKPKSNTLNCGIFAWAGLSPKSFNQHKFNLLGVFNEERGTDSCGITVDGEIFLGVDKYKKFRNFVADVKYDVPQEIPIVIGHTRNGPIGTYTLDNAHPFGFGESEKDKSKYAFIGVHNGTIYNHKELAKKYNVELKKEKAGSKFGLLKIDKIDSEILLESIYRSQSYKVLSNYNGAAAIIFYDVNNPKTLYCFRGESATYSHYSMAAEERPLYAYQEHKNSLYLSSQKNGLEFIGGDDTNIVSLDTNTVYKIKNGNLETAEKISVSRINQQIKKDNSSYTKKSKNLFNAYDDYDNAYYGHDFGCGIQLPKNRSSAGGRLNSSSSFQSKFPNIVFDNILDDTTDVVPSKKIYTEKLRYWRNGHLITGIYVWIKGFGFHLMGQSATDAKNTFWTVVGKKFNKDGFYSGKTINYDREWFIPFPAKVGVNKKDSDISKYFYYFYEGVRVKTLLDFNACLNFKLMGQEYTISALSNAACHPIVDLKERKDDDAQGIFNNGVLANDSFCPLGSSKVYKIKKGNCIEIKSAYKKGKVSSFSNLNILKAELEEHEEKKYTNNRRYTLVEIEEKVLKEEKKAIIKLAEKTDTAKEKFIEEEKIDLLIDELFIPTMTTFQNNINKLEEFIDTEKGSKAVDAFNNFLIEASLLTATEIHNE